MGRAKVHESAHTANILRPIYVVSIEFVSLAIKEADFSQHSLGHLCPMNQLDGEQNPLQLHDERSNSLPCYDQRDDKILNSHPKLFKRRITVSRTLVTGEPQ